MKASHILIVLCVSIAMLMFLNYQEVDNEAAERLKQSSQMISQRTRMDTALILKARAEKLAEQEQAKSKPTAPK